MSCALCGHDSEGELCVTCASYVEASGRVGKRVVDEAGAGQCARGCTHYRRHRTDCPAEDHQAGAWVPAPAVTEDQRHKRMSADLRALDPDVRQWARDTHIGPYGGFEVWHPCNGCRPRRASHGAFCDQCDTKLAQWLGGQTKDNTWTPTQGSIAWAYWWLASDMEPRQAGGSSDKVAQGKKVPPASLALHIHDLRQELAKALGQWLRSVTQEHSLTGPAWWAYRVGHRSDDESSWRSWLPQNQAEVTDAQRYLVGWLERIEESASLGKMIYTEATELLAQVSSIAPWQARAVRLPNLPCPACERDALVRYDGDEVLTCTRCREIVPREKYDRWTELLRFEKAS